jgi:transcription elongation factor Elf1
MKKTTRKAEQNVCPICGSENISYSCGEIDETGVTYECECSYCGASFNECYDLVFAGNWNITDKDGNEYEDIKAQQ